MRNELPNCEVCGLSAPWLINDIREGEPEQGVDSLWMTWQVISTHHYCDQHVRAPIQYTFHMRDFIRYNGVLPTLFTIRVTQYYLHLVQQGYSEEEIKLHQSLFIPDVRDMRDLVDSEGVLLYAPADFNGERYLK